MAVVTTNPAERYRRHVSTELTWTGVFETVEGGWVQARILEFPAVITAAPTLAEAKELLLDALREYLESLRQDDPVVTQSPEVHHEQLHIVIDAA